VAGQQRAPVGVFVSAGVREWPGPAVFRDRGGQVGGSGSESESESGSESESESESESGSESESEGGGGSGSESESGSGSGSESESESGSESGSGSESESEAPEAGGPRVGGVILHPGTDSKQQALLRKLRMQRVADEADLAARLSPRPDECLSLQAWANWLVF
jgi:hypothetical protein